MVVIIPPPCHDKVLSPLLHWKSRLLWVNVYNSHVSSWRLYFTSLLPILCPLCSPFSWDVLWALKEWPFWGLAGTSPELRGTDASLMKMLRIQRDYRLLERTAGPVGPSSAAQFPPLALHLHSLVPTSGVTGPRLWLLTYSESWSQALCWQGVPFLQRLHMGPESIILKGLTMHLFSEVIGQTQLLETKAQFIKLRWLIMG